MKQIQGNPLPLLTQQSRDMEHPVFCSNIYIVLTCVCVLLTLQEIDWKHCTSLSNMVLNQMADGRASLDCRLYAQTGHKDHPGIVQ